MRAAVRTQSSLSLGYAITSVGFGMVINPTWAALPGYLFLGLVVGADIHISVSHSPR